MAICSRFSTVLLLCCTWCGKALLYSCLAIGPVQVCGTHMGCNLRMPQSITLCLVVHGVVGTLDKWPHLALYV